MSTTLLYLSPAVNSPELYCFSISFTSFSAFVTIFTFSFGITISLTPMETPEIVEYLNPVYIIWSARRTVSFKPARRYDASNNSEIPLLSKSLFIYLKGMDFGKISAKTALPTVVSTIFAVAGRLSSSLSLTFILTLIFA